MVAFTWLDKFTAVLALIESGEERRAVEVALVEYGAFGVEPDGLPYTARLVFESLRDDIDYSVSAHDGARKGGRPKVDSKKPLPETPGKNPGLETPGFKPRDTNPGLETPGFKPRDTNPGLETQSKAKQSKALQSKHIARAGARIAPPTVTEVEAYCLEKGYTFDAEAFVAYYAARGWRTNKGAPLKDWRAACVTWNKNEGGFGERAPNAPQGDEIDWSVYR